MHQGVTNAPECEPPIKTCTLAIALHLLLASTGVQAQGINCQWPSSDPAPEEGQAGALIWHSDADSEDGGPLYRFSRYLFNSGSRTTDPLYWEVAGIKVTGGLRPSHIVLLCLPWDKQLVRPAVSAPLYYRVGPQSVPTTVWRAYGEQDGMWDPPQALLDSLPELKQPVSYKGAPKDTVQTRIYLHSAARDSTLADVTLTFWLTARLQNLSFRDMVRIGVETQTPGVSVRLLSGHGPYRQGEAEEYKRVSLLGRSELHDLGLFSVSRGPIAVELYLPSSDQPELTYALPYTPCGGPNRESIW